MEFLIKKCKYCKIELKEGTKINMCSSCRSKYNEMYYKSTKGKFIVFYYFGAYKDNLIKVKKISRLVSLIKDKDVMRYMTSNNVCKGQINIWVTDVSNYENEQVNKLIRYIEQLENSIIKHKTKLAKKDIENIQKIYNQIIENRTSYYLFKRDKKRQRKKINIFHS